MRVYKDHAYAAHHHPSLHPVVPFRPQVLVEAAEDLAKEAASSSSSGGEAVPSSEALQKLLQRAACLLDALSSWADSHEQEAAAAAEEAARASATPRGSTPTSGQRRSLVCWQQLRSISWCPVVQVPPHPSMPWPEPSSLRPGLLFPPRMVRRAADGWLCSAAMRLLQGTASPALCGALGWDAPLKAPVLVGQLVELGGRQLITPGTPADAPRSTADLEAAGSVVEEACAALYNALGATLVSGSSNEQGQLLSTTLPDAAVVWVGAGFVLGSLVRSVRAQRQPSEQEQQQQEVAGADVQEDSLEAAAQAAIAAGLLWELPATLLSRLTPVGLQILAAAGVDDGFSCSSFVQALAALADMAPPGVPLPEQQAQLAALLAEAAGVLASEAGAPALVMLPDADGRMAPASQLFVADAPWLLEEGVAETGWRFVSPSVSITAAVALGALSMRSVHGHHHRYRVMLSCHAAQDNHEQALLCMVACHHFSILSWPHDTWHRLPADITLSCLCVMCNKSSSLSGMPCLGYSMQGSARCPSTSRHHSACHLTRGGPAGRQLGGSCAGTAELATCWTPQWPRGPTASGTAAGR
jgi:sacsin